MQKYLYTMCFFSTVPLIAGSGTVNNIPGSLLSSSELEKIQKSAEKNEDSVVLLDGTVISGTLTHLPELAYSFGKMPIEVKDIAIIAFSPKSEKNKIQIITHQGYSYVAELPNETFTIVQILPNRQHPKYTIQKEIAPSLIRYVTFKEKEANISNSKKRIFDIELKNGDHIPASIATDVISLSTGLRDEKIKTDDLLHLNVDFGIHGYTKNRQGEEKEFDYTYAKDKFLNLQIAQTQQTLGLPWALINKITRVEPRIPSSTVSKESQTQPAQATFVKTEEEKTSAEPVKQKTFAEKKTVDGPKKTPARSTDISSDTVVQKNLLNHLELEIARTKLLEQSLNNLQGQLDTNDQKSLQIVSKYEAELESLQDILVGKQEKIYHLEKEIESAQIAFNEWNASQEKAGLENTTVNPSDQVGKDEQVNLVYNLETEISRTRMLQESLARLYNDLDKSERKIDQIVTRFEDEITILQNVVGDKQQKIDELESNQSSIDEWKNNQLRSVVADAREEIDRLIAEQVNPEEHINLVYNLESEMIRTRTLASSFNNLYGQLEKADKSTSELICRFEEEVKGLQALLSGKQTQVQFSEKELENTLQEIAEWKNFQKEEVARYEKIATNKEKDVARTSRHSVELLSEIDHLVTALTNERNNTHLLEQHLENLQGNLQITEEKAKSLHHEFQRQLVTRDQLEEKYISEKNLLETTVASLQNAFQEGQKQLAEKEGLIKTLTEAKAELSANLYKTESTHSNLSSEYKEHQLHLISDIDNMTTALETERTKALTLQNNLDHLVSKLQEADQNSQNLSAEFTSRGDKLGNLEAAMAQLQESLESAKKEISEKDHELNDLTFSKKEIQYNLISEIESLDELIGHKERRIEELEIQLDRSMNVGQRSKTDLEDQLAIQKLELEHDKTSLAEKSTELEYLRATLESTTQFAERLEKQFSSLSQNAASFGDEFVMTTQKLSDSLREIEEIREANHHLQQELSSNAEHFNDVNKHNHELEEYIVKLTHSVKEFEEQLTTKSHEIEELRTAFHAQQKGWEEMHVAKEIAYTDQIHELESKLDTEIHKVHALNHDLDNVRSITQNHVKEIEELTADVNSERDLNRELGVQLQRVHTTETGYKNKLEKQAETLDSAQTTIDSLKADKLSYIEELQIKNNELNKLASEIANLEEKYAVVKDYEAELIQIKQERDALAQELENERQALADKASMINRLSEIVKIQKKTLERIERSQIACN